MGKAELFVVWLYDGFDNHWMEITKPVPRADAERVWNERTEDGTVNTKYDDIDYYRIEPADRRVVSLAPGGVR